MGEAGSVRSGRGETLVPEDGSRGAYEEGGRGEERRD